MSIHRSNILNIFLIICVIVSMGCGKEKIEVPVQKINSGTTLPLRSIQFINSDTGYVAGSDRYFESIILRTNDQGETWEDLTPDYEFTAIDVSFDDYLNGVATAFFGKLVSTIDGGANWSLLETRQTDYAIRSFQKVTNSNLIAVGGDGFSFGMIFQSLDGGLNWAYDSLDFELRDVHFKNENQGFACGYGTLLTTEDAGQSWQFDATVRGDFFVAMDFPSNETGFILGNQAKIFKTTNGGVSWEKINNTPALVPSNPLTDIHFLNDQLGYVCGRSGLIWKTEDGGDTWKEFDSFTDEALLSIQSISPSYTLVTGEEGGIYRFAN